MFNTEYNAATFSDLGESDTEQLLLFFFLYIEKKITYKFETINPWIPAKCCINMNI